MARLRKGQGSTYRLHKSRGLGVVTINGRNIYLGNYGTPESWQEYHRVLLEWRSVGQQLPPHNRAFSLPLKGQVRRGHDQNALAQAAELQLADQQARHDGLAGARVVRKQEAHAASFSR